MIQDFGRNFSAKYQDEIKSAHWVKKEVTVHPIVAYYVDPATKHFTWDSLVMLSDDLNHDHHIVAHFQQVAIKYLQNVRNLPISLLIQINDGCANQKEKCRLSWTFCNCKLTFTIVKFVEKCFLFYWMKSLLICFEQASKLEKKCPFDPWVFTFDGTCML